MSLHGAFSPEAVPVSASHVLRSRHAITPSNHDRNSATRRALFSVSSLMPPPTSDWIPLYLSGLAGASTCLGAAIVFFSPGKQNTIGPNTLSFSLALAGSVMITVSVLSLGPECLRDPSFTNSYRIMPLWSKLFLERIVSFAFGCALYRLLSYFTFPEPEELLGLEVPINGEDNDALLTESRHASHLDDSAMRVRRSMSTQLSSSMDSWDVESSTEDSLQGVEQTTTLLHEEEYPIKTMSLSRLTSGQDLDDAEQRRAWRVAMLLFVSLLFHNFPEGLAVAASALESTDLGITVTIGIMIHNIPEGIAIAVPCLAARPDRPWLAFLLASGSGLAEPLGAAVALWILKYTEQTLPLENVLAFVAGIMVMVALCELFPEANRRATSGKEYLVAGTLSGVAVMAATELYL